MKKLMTLAALAACLPAFATAEVESSNTVGYKKVTLQPGLNMIGGLFQGVGTGEALDLNAQFADAAENANYGTGADNADQIVTWDAVNQGYTKIYYYVCEDDQNPDEDYDYKWYDSSDSSGEPTGFALPAGAGFWYKHLGSGGTITFSKTY